MPPKLDVEMLNSDLMLLKDESDTRTLMLNREQAQLLTRILADHVRAGEQTNPPTQAISGSPVSIDPDGILYG